MIRYVGSKLRLGKEIAFVLSQYMDTHTVAYKEPFFGGGGIAQYTQHFNIPRYASDIHEDLILMYQALQLGWLPPNTVSEELYKELKYSEPSALRGYVGFGISFGGKWFGGYARDKIGKRKYDLEPYNRIIRSIEYIKDIQFTHQSYEHTIVGENMVIYCDPPYNGTLTYKGTTEFDYTVFWDTMRLWSNTGATVIVSEYNAPDDFTSVWEKPYKTYLSTVTLDKVERLFKYKG